MLLCRAKAELSERTGEGLDNEEDAPRRNKKTDNPAPPRPEFYLLDAETGALQKVDGEFAPLKRPTYRSLQPKGAPHEFWAAVYDAKSDEKSMETAAARYETKIFHLLAGDEASRH